MPILFNEKRDIETAFGMGSGYVSDFSDRTFSEFIAASINLDIYGGAYSSYGSSKAKHLRCFFDKAGDNLVGRLLHDLIVHARQVHEESYSPPTQVDKQRYDRCLAIASRLKQASLVENIDAIRPNADDKDFAVLAKIIKEGIEKNEPGPVLDRLHTFCMKYFRAVCQKRLILFEKTDNLGNLVGKYVKYLESEKIVEAKITIQILKSSITTFSEFNYIRNNKSLAHDNETLNNHESMLLFNAVANTIRFVEHVEDTTPTKPELMVDVDDDIPF